MFPQVGSEFAGYRLESVIARGGMSTVFLGQNLRLARKVAVKILAQELSEDDTFRERFVRESLIAASLDHPNVIPIYDAGENDGLLFLAMRYVQGPQLKEVIETSGPLRPDRLLPIVSQVGGALDAAHARGLIHRDVKPGNILIDPLVGQERTDHVYLCDFGLTKQTTSHSGLTRTGQFVGTIDYMAPEQIEGKDIDSRTDIYSFGCVLYECLTGSVPFKKPTEAAVLWAHIQELPVPATQMNAALPGAIDDVITTALDKHPNARYQTCADMVAAVRSAFAGAAAGATSAAGAIATPLTGPVSTPSPVPEAIDPPPAPPVTERASADAGTPAEGTGGPSTAPPRVAPGPPPPTPAPRRSLTLAAAIALLVGAVLGGGIAYALARSDTTPAAAGASRAVGGTQCTDVAGNPVSVGSPGSRLTEGTLTCLLSKHIPTDVRARCRTGTGDVSASSADLPPQLGVSQLKADVFLQCSVPFSGTDFDVWYLFKHDRIDVAYDYQAVLSANGFDGLGRDGTVFYVDAGRSDCAAGTPLERRWYVVVEANGETIRHTFEPQPIVLGIPSTGRFACWRDADQQPWIAWTDANLPVLALARASGAGYSRDLVDWWQNRAGPGHPPNA
jgi:serine/threonine-protein kinase